MLSGRDLSALTQIGERLCASMEEWAPMASYRIYMLDQADRVVTGSDADCRDDETALAWASATLGTDVRAEIWQSTRCVGRVSNVFVPLNLARQAAAAD